METIAYRLELPDQDLAGAWRAIACLGGRPGDGEAVASRVRLPHACWPWGAAAYLVEPRTRGGYYKPSRQGGR